MLSAHNMAVMVAVPEGENAVARLLDSLQSNSIFAKREQDNILQYVALSLADERLNPEEVNQDLQKAIGTPIDNFTTFNKRSRNFICISGLTYPKTRLKDIEELISNSKDAVMKSKETSLELNADMSFLQTSSKKEEKEYKEESLESIWDKYML